MVIEVKPLQPEKQEAPNDVTDEGMVIEVKPLQYEKQELPNEITDEGMAIEVKPLQYEKQELPNEVTDEGMVIEVKPLQPKKQEAPNEVTTYSTPSLPLTFSGIIISPEYSPSVLGTSVAVFVSDSNKYRKPSITSNFGSCAIALLVVMSIRTTNITKPLKRLLVPLLQSKNPFLKVKSFIIFCI